MEAEKITDEFVLEYFNSKCNVFQTALRIPLGEWLKVMEENGEKIRLMFATSQTFRDIMVVERVL